MKKAGRIISLVMILVMLASAFCYAAEGDTFDLINSNPKDGATGASVENLSVKLYFDATFTEDVLKDTNDNCFQLLNPDGEKLPIRVLYATKEEGVVLVILDNADNKIKVQGNETYTLKISDSFRSDDGSTYGKNTDITFTTMNTQRNMLVNMLMMFVMFGGMMFFSMKSARKAAEEQEQKRKEEKVNPYKEAKRTGKSVEEIVEQEEKEKARRAAKEARKAAKEEEFEFDFSDNYKVKRPRPISEGGGKYITGRKAAAEAKKAEAEARKAQKKAQANKGKGKKK